MGNGSERGRFARFLVEVRFGWQVSTPRDRMFDIAGVGGSATMAIVAIIVGVTDAIGIGIGLVLLSVAMPITDAWRTGHRLLKESDIATKPARR